MKLRHILLASTLLAASSMGAAVVDPITKAVLDSYDELLATDAKDYITYYERAALYYKLSDYDKALVDLGKALQYTPAKDQDMRSREFALVADIYTELKDYDKALINVESALALTPTDYALLYKKGNILLYNNNPEEAFRIFSAMQRMRSRSQEAFYGMAKASIMMGKEYQALEYIQQAENSAPGSDLTYTRLGDLYADLNRTEDATRNYLKAFLIADKGSRSLQGLIKMSEMDFPTVSKVIDMQIKSVSENMSLYFLKASLALESHNYPAAYESYSILLQNPELQEASLYSQLAKSSIAIGKTDDALEAATRAVGLEPTPENYELLACAQLLNDQAAEALQTIAKGETAPGGMVTKSLALRANGKYDEAVSILNTVLMENPEDEQALMLRALIKSVDLNDKEGGRNDFNRMGRLPDNDEVGMFYQGYGLTAAGCKIDGDEIIAKMTAKYPTGRSAYLAAVYYDKEGNQSKTEEMIELAKARNFFAKYEPSLKPLWK